MAAQKGDIGFPFSFETEKKQLLDAKMYVENYSDLITYTTDRFLFKMPVFCAGLDDPTKMGWWLLINPDNPSDYMSWTRGNEPLPFNMVRQIGSFTFNTTTYEARLGQTLDWIFNQNGTDYTVGNTPVQLTAPDPDDPRADIIVWSYDDGYEVVEGTPSQDYVIPTTPVGTILVKTLIRNVDGSVEPIDPPDLSEYVPQSETSTENIGNTLVRRLPSGQIKVGLAWEPDVWTFVNQLADGRFSYATRPRVITALGINSKLDDAPSDGKTYGRKDATWSEVEVEPQSLQEVTDEGATTTTPVGFGGSASNSRATMAANTSTISSIRLVPSSTDYTGTDEGAIWNNGGEIKAYINGEVVNILKSLGNDVFEGVGPRMMEVNASGDTSAVSEIVIAEITDLDIIDDIEAAIWTNNEADITGVKSGQYYYSYTTHYKYEAVSDGKMIRR